MNFDEIFPQTLLINLESRTDRLEEATRELGREAVLWERLPAVDAAEVKRPRGYDRPGAYALALRIRLTLRRALREGWETVFFFEDDVVLADGLHGKLAQVQLPEDWDFFYLGCVHCHPAVVLAPNLVRSLGATSSHAFGVNRKAFRQLLQALRPATGSMPREPVAIDQVLCRLHRETRAYACFPNLAWQRDGYSDLEGKHFSSFSPDGTPWQWRECLADAQAAWLAAEYEKAVALENEPEATATPLEGLRLYLGCQGRPDHGWIAQDLPHLRVSKRLPFHDRTVAAIVMDEVVRHLSPEEAVILFDECQRILKPGGMLRLTFAVLKGLWQTLDTAVMKKERTEKLHDGTVRGAVSALASAHTTLWHPEDLLLLLTSRGYFAEQCRPGESAIPSFQAVPHPCCQGHLAGIEATKPPDGSGSIPRIFHAIWLGPKPMPPQQAAWMEGW